METKREHRRLDLTPEEWQRLELLAEETSSRPRRGVNAYQPDWRAMLRRIANGEIVVSEATPNPHIKRIDDALAKLQTPEQEPPFGVCPQGRIGEYESDAGKAPKPRKYRQLSILEAEAA